MAKQNSARKLDDTFQALADPTRRAVVMRLARGRASVGELARDHAMALPTFMRHLSVLERGGLIVTKKQGRVRTCDLKPETLSVARDWIGAQHTVWNRKLDRLGDLLAQQED